MSLLATIALAASGATLPACSWDHPGVDPFMSDVTAAVDHYQDIPADTRAKLKARMEKRDYDEIVSITRDGIEGRAQYGSEIRDMHFGAGSICKTVTRTHWTQTMQERGLVYCEDGQCILVPTVCRNVSRIRRIGPRPMATAAGATPASAARESDDPATELEMDPPGAGLLSGGSPGAGSTSFAQMAGPADVGLPAGPGAGLPSLVGPSGGSPAVSGIPALPPLPPGSSTITSTPSGTPSDGSAPAVPEPSTWALLLGGLGTVVFTARRRRLR